MNPFPMGRFGLPATSEEGNTVYSDKRLKMSFTVEDGSRQIQCEFLDFYKGKPFTCDIRLEQPQMDTMVIATPWKEKKTAFYYNQKINCMKASGYMEYDGTRYTFSRDTDYGTLDWGRGVWTYDNRWYWGQQRHGRGSLSGFNIGYGFGDTSAASENMLFYDGVCHKSMISPSISRKMIIGSPGSLHPATVVLRWTFCRCLTGQRRRRRLSS